jgi:tetratricopeptide (TPR) repeat protein
MEGDIPVVATAEGNIPVVATAGQASAAEVVEEQKESEDTILAAIADADKAKAAKGRGNDHYKSGDYDQAIEAYTEAIAACPTTEEYKTDLSMYYSNRAAVRYMHERWQGVVDDCTCAVENNKQNLKAYLRRGKAYEKLEDTEKALGDMKAVLALEPKHTEALAASARLEIEEKKRLEKMKDEMLGKLKDLGNGILGKFGMSLDNFKAVQDPATGSYNVNFQR